MSKTRRRFTPAFKLRVVREIEAGKPVAVAAREHQLHPNLIYRWKRKYRDGGPNAFAPAVNPAPNDEAKIAELERLIGQLTIENSFLKKRLGPPRTRRNSCITERLMIAKAIESVRQEQGVGQVKRLCKAAGISRSTFYRLRDLEPAADAEETRLRGLIQEIALKWPAYGYRRITAELRRRGHRVNHKRVLRLMREDNLLCLRKKRFAVTTDSDHDLPVYPNLTADLEVTGLNQLWVADFTYVRLEREFVYLAVVLDAFSRRCIGWALGRSLEASLTIAALWQALESRSVGLGLIHHSDRGVQYASRDYTGLPEAHDIRISMSRRACPYDNAQQPNDRSAQRASSRRRGARKYISMSTKVCVRLGPRLATSSTASTTKSVCTRRWATARPPSSKRASYNQSLHLSRVSHPTGALQYTNQS
jgi:transposase InsO family protein/transposase-like protein